MRIGQTGRKKKRSLFKQAVGFSVEDAEMQQQTSVKTAMGEQLTVALTRAIEHTYIVSPLDMAGMIDMAPTLGVYHYGYFTLKDRDIQYHGPTTYPRDKIANWTGD